MKKVTLQIQGGLGNQLFQIQFGVLLKEIRKIRLHYHFHKNTNHHASSNSLDFQLCSLNIEKSQVTVFGRDRKHVFLRSVKDKVPKQILDFSEDSSCYNDAQINSENFLSELSNLEIPRRSFIRGFFQNVHIFEASKRLNVGIKPRLSCKTKWYERMHKRIQDDGLTIMHVRRGDYAQSPLWGLLSAEYYESALTKLNVINPREVLIFTDSYSDTRREFSVSKMLKDIEIVKTPIESPASESLILMSTARRLVLSNSTYAIWAGLLSNSKEVVVPTKFFRNKSDQYKRTLDAWQKIPPRWVS